MSIERNIAIVGLGGIGYYLGPLLIRWLALDSKNKDIKTTVYLVDGDIIESKNNIRVYTPSDVGRSKCRAMEALVTPLIADTSCNIVKIVSPITPRTVQRHNWTSIKDITVFGCVDNNPSRLFIEQMLEKNGDATFIAGGNVTYTGESYVVQFKNGKCTTGSLVEQNIGFSLVDDEDVFPDNKLDCVSRSEEDPQLSLVNSVVANIMVMQYFSLLHNNGDISNDRTQSSFDIRNGASLSVQGVSCTPDTSIKKKQNATTFYQKSHI